MRTDAKASFLLSWVRSALDAPRYYLAELWRRLNNEPVFIWAQAIAFKVLITILPLILIATGIFGLVLRQPNPFETVADYLTSFLPPGQAAPLIDLMSRLQAASPTLTIVGVIALFVIIVTLFSVLRYVIGTAMGSGRHRYRSVLHGYMFDVRMVVQVGLLFVLSFGLTLGVNYLNTAGQELLLDWGFDRQLLQRGEGRLLAFASLMVPFLLSLFMFWQLFYLIPRPRPPGVSAFFGSFFAAILFDAAKNAFTLYATYLGQFNRYASGDEALGGVFGLVIAFVLWVYFSGLVLIIGAMLTHLHELRTRPERSRLRGYARKYLFLKHHSARRTSQKTDEEDLEPAEPTSDTHTSETAAEHRPDARAAALDPDVAAESGR